MRIRASPDLAVLLLGRSCTRLRGAAEVAAAVRIQGAEPAVIAQHSAQRSKGRSRPFLLEELAQKDFAIGVIQRDHQVVHYRSRQPLVRGCVQMHQHADQRLALAPAPVFTPPRLLLHQSRLLPRLQRIGVGQLHAVLLGDALVKVPHRKVRIDLALESAQLTDGLPRDAPAPRPSPALVHYRRYPAALDRPPDSPHVPRRHANYVAAATQLSCPSIAFVIISRLVIALTSRAVCRACSSIPRLYPARRTSLSAYDPDIFSAYYTR